MADQQKDNKVEFSTFLLWGKQNVIGYKTQIKNSKTYVTFIWCKCCAQYKNAISSHLKRSTQISALAFIKDTGVITIHQVSFFNSSNPRFLFLKYDLSFTSSIFTSSRLRMFSKISVLKNFVIFTGKHLC